MPHIPTEWAAFMTAPESVGPDGSSVAYRLEPTDHPAALVFGLNAPAVVALAQHLGDLDDLSEGGAYYLMLSVEKARAQAAQLADELLVVLRAKGASWSTIGAALDVPRSTARDRYFSAVERLGSREHVLWFTSDAGTVQTVVAVMDREIERQVRHAIDFEPEAIVALSSTVDGTHGPHVFRAGRLQFVN